MKNATDTTAHLPVRSAAHPEPTRTREMPLLFQLADVNRAVAASTPPAPAATAISPAPLDVPPLPGKFPATSFPLASSLFTSGQLDPWPTPPAGLFESSSSLSTAALAIGAAAAAATKEQPQTDDTTAAVIASGLPAAIDSAVKAAAVISDAAEIKTEVKTELKTELTSESKSAALATPPAELKAESKPEPKAEAKAPPPAGEASTTPKSSAQPAEKAATAATTDKPSPASLRRQRAEARQQKVEGKGNDWLQTHGKVIAIGFVIALIATIYLARRNRGTDAAPALDSPAGLAIDVPGDDQPNHTDHNQQPTEVANTAPRLTEPPSSPQDTTPSPATTEPTASPATATAELQSPIVPSTTQPTTAPTNEPLFPWQNESRTATAPQAPTFVQPFTTPTAEPTTTAPTLNAPTYPETNLRDAPLLPPAPPAAPSNGSAPAPAGGQGRGPGAARSYPASFTSAPDGNRYERTGSGLY